MKTSARRHNQKKRSQKAKKHDSDGHFAGVQRRWIEKVRRNCQRHPGSMIERDLYLFEEMTPREFWLSIRGIGRKP